mgnify:CR=1 FL=1
MLLLGRGGGAGGCKWGVGCGRCMRSIAEGWGVLCRRRHGQLCRHGHCCMPSLTGIHQRQFLHYHWALTMLCHCAVCSGGDLPPGLMDEVKAAVDTVEKEMGKKFGDKDNTLLFSVRSGAAVSTLLCGCVCVWEWEDGGQGLQPAAWGLPRMCSAVSLRSGVR